MATTTETTIIATKTKQGIYGLLEGVYKRISTEIIEKYNIKSYCAYKLNQLVIYFLLLAAETPTAKTIIF